MVFSSHCRVKFGVVNTQPNIAVLFRHHTHREQHSVRDSILSVTSTFVIRSSLSSETPALQLLSCTVRRLPLVHRPFDWDQWFSFRRPLKNCGYRIFYSEPIIPTLFPPDRSPSSLIANCLCNGSTKPSTTDMSSFMVFLLIRVSQFLIPNVEKVWPSSPQSFLLTPSLLRCCCWA